MQKIIACCGLNCSNCDAFIATLNNDDDLRQKTAEKWREMYHAPELTPEMINCTGCRKPGAKFSHCTKCEIRNCARNRGYSSCADCAEVNTCKILSAIHMYVPEAAENLRNLN